MTESSAQQSTPLPKSPPPSTDRVVLWFVGGLVMGFIPVLIALLWGEAALRWLGFSTAAIVVVAIVIMLTMRGGWLSRGRRGGSPIAMVIAIGSLACYLVGAALITPDTTWIEAMIVVTALWLSGTLLLWRGMRDDRSIGNLASGLAVLLISAGSILAAVAIPEAVPRIFLLVLGLAAFCLALGNLFARLILIGVACLLGAGAFIPAGVLIIQHAPSAGTMALLFGCICAVLAPIYFTGRPWVWMVVMSLLGLLLATAAAVVWAAYSPLGGAALACFGAAAACFAIGDLVKRSEWAIVGMAIAGVGGIIWGASLLISGEMLLGIGNILASLAVLSFETLGVLPGQSAPQSRLRALWQRALTPRAPAVRPLERNASPSPSGESIEVNRGTDVRPDDALAEDDSGLDLPREEHPT